MIDIVRCILGEPAKVVAEARWETDALHEELCAVQLTFDNGSVAMIAASRQAGQWYERVEMFGGGKTVIVESPDKLTVIRNDKDEVYNSTNLEKGWADYVDYIGFRPCDQHFIDCVRTRKQPLTSARDAYKTELLVNRILQAAGLPDLEHEWEYSK